MIEALDHVQVAMPAGRERQARAFYSGLLGLNELEKPATLAGRGGAWFGLPDGRQRHLGVEEPLEGFAVRWNDGLAPRRRFYGEDPFGNRLEFLEPGR